MTNKEALKETVPTASQRDYKRIKLSNMDVELLRNKRGGVRVSKSKFFYLIANYIIQAAVLMLGTLLHVT